jgi:cytochrome P450
VAATPRKGPPPGPRGDLLLGSTLDFKDRPARFIRYVAQAYGDVTRFRVGPVHWYLLAHPEDIQDAMTRRADVFIKPAIARRLWDPFLGDGLLTAEGEAWKRLHTLVRPAFHRTRIHGYGDVMTAYTDRMIDGWTAGSRLDLDEAMVALTLEIVAKTLFDADIADGAETFGRAMDALQRQMVEHIHMPLPVPRWWPSAGNRRKVEAIDTIEGIVWGVIEARRASGEDRGDLLSMLLLSRDEDGNGLTDKEIRDQAMTLFFAGHETSAHQMTWAWYLLARNPHAAARLQREIDAVTGGSRLTVAHLKQLPYLEWTFLEAMRMQPSVWVFMKETTEDVEVRGYRIPKGSPVVISPWVTHHDARWFPSPETFDPERFSPERARSIPKGAYVPFSGGQRICLGKAFAMMEGQLVLGTMLQRLTPAVPADYELAFTAELSMHPDGPLPIDAIFRGSPPLEDRQGA